MICLADVIGPADRKRQVAKMRRGRASLIFALLLGLTPATAAHAQKSALDDSIRRREEQSWDAAKKIWSWAEPGYQETKSSALLADLLEDAGFRLQRKAAGIATAFTATYGDGKPLIGMIG